MFRPTDKFRIAFAIDNLGEEELARQELAVLLAAFVEVDRAYLRAHPETPLLSTALAQGLRFEPEPQGAKPPGEEDWQDIPTCLHKRRDGTRAAGNRDLVCWRVAELRERFGVQAHPVLERMTGLPDHRTAGLFSYRTLVRLPDGKTEDLTGDEGFRRCEARMRITYVLDLFDGDRDRALSEQTLQILLHALTNVDVVFLKRHPRVPDLYRSGIRYMEEPPGQEDWQDIPTSLRMRFADCEDVAAYRAAELNVKYGIDAEPYFISHKKKDGGMLYHILVKGPEGRGMKPEDPSHTLGMR